jgi:uncharacterized protein YdiU (UPF0061 family)
MMANKLGFTTFIEEYHEPLITELLDILAAVETDMTIFFRQLANVDPLQSAEETATVPQPLLSAYYQPDELDDSYTKRLHDWLTGYRSRLAAEKDDPTSRRTLMNNTNPKYVLRNYQAQEAIELAENGDYSRIHELLELLRHPYDEQPEKERFFSRRPEWARHKAGCSMLS